MPQKEEKLSRFGFGYKRGGAHLSRTMMLAELKLLFSYVTDSEANNETYRRAIEEENCLGKRSMRTRRLTYKHLTDLYGLDSSVTIFRTLRYFWDRDNDGQPLLALLCAVARDPILWSTIPFILNVSEGKSVPRQDLENFIDAQEPGRFSKATLKSAAQNVNATWTQSGHLTGKTRKVRSRASPTPGSVAYALLLGYLNGIRGQSLFHTHYCKLLDCPPEKTIELAENASQRGWFVLKHIGDVIEVEFPDLLKQEEMEAIREPD